MAKAVEVAHGEARSGGQSDRGLDPFAQLLRGLQVVGEDEDLLGEEGVWLVVAAPGPEQVGDALDDDPRLARPGARDHD